MSNSGGSMLGVVLIIISFSNNTFFHKTAHSVVSPPSYNLVLASTQSLLRVTCVDYRHSENDFFLNAHTCLTLVMQSRNPPEACRGLTKTKQQERELIACTLPFLSPRVLLLQIKSSASDLCVDFSFCNMLIDAATEWVTASVRSHMPSLSAKLFHSQSEIQRRPDKWGVFLDPRCQCASQMKWEQWQVLN